MFLFTLRSVLAGMLLVQLPLAVAQPQAYQLRDLGTLGGSFSYPRDINDAGQVVGYSETAAELQIHAFLFQNGSMTDLGTLGGITSDAYSINQAGQIVGEATRADGSLHAFLYENAMMVDLGTLNGTYSGGTAINSAGQVTGYAGVSELHYHGFAYSNTQGLMADLGTLGDSFSQGYAINDLGQIAGLYENQFELHAFLYRDGVMIDLAPGSASYVNASPRVINNLGHVTGSYGSFELQRAFIYRDGGILDLGTLGGVSSIGYAINESSQITGYSITGTGEAHAFVYSDGRMSDLGTLGGSLSIAYDINDAGQTTGFSSTALTSSAAGATRPFVYSGGRMVELDIKTLSPAATEGAGLAINNQGQVVGWYNVLLGDSQEPVMRAFLATPVASVFARLLSQVVGIGAGQSLANKLRAAERHYSKGNLRASCSFLPGVLLELRALAGKKIPRAQVNEIAAEVTAVRRALGC